MARFSTLAALEVPFRLAALNEVPAPAGSDGTWHEYVIEQGTNTITGMRPGIRAEVVSQLEIMVARLNDRREGKRSK